MARADRTAASAARFLLCGLTVLALAATACSRDDPGGSSITSSTPTTVPESSSTPASTTTAPVPVTDAGKVFEITFADGDVRGPNQVEVNLGDKVTLRITSDVVEEVHVHTYDIRVDLVAGAPGSVTFSATIPGRHEVELEGRHRRLLTLVVS